MLSALRLVQRRRPGGAGNAPPTSSEEDEDAPLVPGAAAAVNSKTKAAPPPAARRRRPASPTFATLPSEIILLIAQHLSYPDALSLKHTSRRFYQLVDTGVELKIDWLMERRLLHRECPNHERCDLGSDLRFCRGSARLLMQRRREHIECESRPGLGCLIYGTRTCPHARKLKTRFKKWMRLRADAAEDRARWMLLLLASLVPLLIGWLCMIGAYYFEV